MKNNWPVKKLGENFFSEDAVCYALYENYISADSKVFFKFAHNIAIKNNRGWDYRCGPEVDVIEIKKDQTIIAYELKGARKHKNGEVNWPGFYDGLGQAIAYLDLPKIWQNNKSQFKGGAFDFIYLVNARPQLEFQDYEKRIFNLLPIGFIIALPDGGFEKVKDASSNPLKDKGAREHLLGNLNTLGKYTTDGRIFRRIKEAGEKYFSK